MQKRRRQGKDGAEGGQDADHREDQRQEHKHVALRETRADEARRRQKRGERDMPDAFALRVARTPPHDHRDHAGRIRQRHDEPGGGVGETHRPNDLRQPQRDAVQRTRSAEKDEAECQHARVSQRPPKVSILHDDLGGEARGNDVLLRAVQPWRRGRAVGQES